MEQPTSIHLELCVELQTQLEDIGPDLYIKPSVRPPPGVNILGDATDLMKRMFTFWRIQEGRQEELLIQLRTARSQGDTDEIKRIAVLFGTNELLSRGVQAAIGYEIGRHFDAFGQRVGVDPEWVVYAENVPPLIHVR